MERKIGLVTSRFGCWGKPGMTDMAVVLSCFTLTFDSFPIKGEGDLVVVLGLLSPSPLIPLPSRERGLWLVWTCSHASCAALWILP